MEQLQQEQAQKRYEVSGGGGAVKATVNGQGELLALAIDAEFLKEDKGLIEETLLSTIQEAMRKAKANSESAMQGLSGGLGFPGLM